MSELTNEQLAELREGTTQGPWESFILDEPLDAIGVYAQRCVDSSPLKEFYFVMGLHPDGGKADICHVGNGPTSAANAKLIAAIPDLLDTIAARQRELDAVNANLAEAQKQILSLEHYQRLSDQKDGLLAELRAKLAPAPCGKPGHTMSAWVREGWQTDVNGPGYSDAHCTLCAAVAECNTPPATQLPAAKEKP